MDAVRSSPGPAAAQAHRIGMIGCAVAGLAAIGAAYWFGVISPLLLGYTLLLLFPVYLVFASVALSVWLGFDKDETALRPVYEAKNSK